MEYGLWTLKVSTPFNTTIILSNATIIYINMAPEKIRSTDGGIELNLYPGEWEISYSYEAPAKPPAPHKPSDQLLYYAIVGACIICVSILAVLYIIRRRKTLKEFSGEEAEILKYIRERGGRVLEAELRERFPHIPRTSMWRLIRRLEKRGVVQVRKVGLQNVVELK
ncbi:hypothetical protein KEJ31_01585 [Candidatus Bathyarchaeota archaeon]|nr:hypothetical protein [Candidatus Bathyarchaeota archaeon]